MVAGSTELLPPPGSDPAPGREGSNDEGISPDEVHKRRPENVWLQDAVHESPHSMHSRFEVPPRGVRIRFVDLIEVQRQIGILQAHRQLGVPRNTVFVLDRIALKFVTRATIADVPRNEGTIRAHIVATGARGRPRSLSQHFSIEVPSGLLAVGTARASLIPQGVYDRVRRLPPESAPSEMRPTTSDSGYAGALVVDGRDPLFSDHPSDHLTAMQVLADVERVAVASFPPAGVRELKLAFYRYTDVEPAPLLRLNVAQRGRFQAEVTQRGARSAKVTGVLDLREGKH